MGEMAPPFVFQAPTYLQPFLQGPLCPTWRKTRPPTASGPETALISKATPSCVSKTSWCQGPGIWLWMCWGLLPVLGGWNHPQSNLREMFGRKNESMLIVTLKRGCWLWLVLSLTTAVNCFLPPFSALLCCAVLSRSVMFDSLQPHGL